MRELPNTGSKIQELQRSLHNKAKAEPKYCFYSLYDKTFRTDILAEAYTRAKANGGRCGVDEETFEDVERKGVAGYLAELQLELKERRYTPLPVVRGHHIPPPQGRDIPHPPRQVRLLGDSIVYDLFIVKWSISTMMV